MLLTFCLIGISTPALGQETRDGQLAAAQAEKAKNVHPYVPTLGERRIVAFEKSLANPPTVYPYLGGVFPGGKFAAGPGYRKRFAGTGRVDAHGAWSIKNFKLAEASLRLPEYADGRLRIDFRANWTDAPKVNFFGVGNASRLDGRTGFLYRSTTADVSARIRPASFFTVGGGLSYLDFDTGPTTRGASIEERFTSADTPGLGADPTYRRGQVYAEVDWRESPGYTTRGGLYRLDWFDYHQTNAGAYSFRRLDTEVAQFLPFLRANWVIALRASASFTGTGADQAVPHFLLPDLGGSGDLRGYPSWRFGDRNRLLLTGEYRWRAGQFVDMALFFDAGKVTARRSDLDLRDLHRSYGIGTRFHTSTTTVMRVEVARTRDEGIGLIWAFNQIF